jgi:hypothetical protein
MVEQRCGNCIHFKWREPFLDHMLGRCEGFISPITVSRDTANEKLMHATFNDIITSEVNWCTGWVTEDPTTPDMLREFRRRIDLG